MLQQVRISGETNLKIIKMEIRAREKNNINTFIFRGLHVNLCRSCVAVTERYTRKMIRYNDLNKSTLVGIVPGDNRRCFISSFQRYTSFNLSLLTIVNKDAVSDE